MKLPVISNALETYKEAVGNFFEPEPGKVRFRDVAREVPGATVDEAQKIGQQSFRGFAAAASGLHDVGQRIQGAIDPTKTFEDYEREFDLALKPTGQFQEDLFGTDKKITAGSFGREVRSGIGGEEIKPLDPTLGLVFGLADALPGGSQARRSLTQASKGLSKLDDLVQQKYGPTIARKIDQLNDTDLKWTSLAKGGEQEVTRKLQLPEVKTTVNKLISSFDDIAQARKETDKMRVQTNIEMSERVRKAQEGKEGIEGLKAARAAMRGERPQAELPAIKFGLEDEEVNTLFRHIDLSDLKEFEKVNAKEGLAKMLGDDFYSGALPQPSQMKLLENVFGEPLVRNFNNTVGTSGDAIMEQIAQVANVPRALMSSLDLSAPLRQGLLLSVDHPKNAMRAFKSMLRFFVDEKHFNEAMNGLANSPMADMRRAAGLELTDVSGQNFSLGTKEEAYMTDLAGKIPGVGIGVRASERAFTGFLNKLRADVFDDVAQEYLREGITPQSHGEEFESLAKFVNVATGRADLPTKTLRQSAPLANALFFSPRFLASRIQMFNPAFYMKMTPRARRMAARSVMKLVGTGATILTMASLNKDAKVGDDPTSSDFGKIVLGDTRYDIWGGFQQVAVLLSRMAFGETTSTSGKSRKLQEDEVFGATHMSVFMRFLRSKLSPVAGGVVDVAEGENVIGDEVTVQQQMFSKLLPFYVQDLVEAGRDLGYMESALKLAPALFGVGVQHFENKSSSGGGILPSLPQLPSLPSI